MCSLCDFFATSGTRGGDGGRRGYPRPRWRRKRTGQKLLRFDRNLGGRFVAGADEAGRGPLAGPLVVAGVLLDYDCLRDHRVRPLALLNDSKQVDAATRDELYRAVLACAERVSVHVFPPAVIDRDGLHKSNLRGLRAALWACQPADVSLVDGFKLGPTAPPHRAIVDGDTKSAAIAAASIVAKVTRDRYMRDGRRAVSRLRLRVARRLHHAGAHARRARARAVRDPPPLVAGARVPHAKNEPSPRHRPSERRAALVVPAARLPDPRRRTAGSAAASSTSSSAAAGARRSAR